ncbi:5-oxoprolinase subunit PxpB [Luteolibacter ambystomatis]|uniref:5-oxoprolinase subunit PxpB n=1 Tax=Luteolibacter ambystomatis TaxID=2824561 RepID=A0A975PFM6_9BACT|nr:5-oxoprolinase subunit PxpB [Luteolibacter ambystomatis]QUE52119.1 5-oxoprolinase subunit PxpB [Luteolibacter ambystomatis]
METRVIPLGDSALILELAETVGALPPHRVHEVVAWLQSPALPGVMEVVPAATTITLFYDPLALLKHGAPADDLTGWLGGEALERLAGLPKESSAPSSRVVEIPVCYGGEHGPDLEEVARRTGLSVIDVVTRHSAAEYLVLQLGFAPGFPYLHGLPDSLSLPRRAAPRLSVAAGSIAIANGQSCIYPQAIPGGWHVIGRTPLKLFRPDHEPPVLLQPGDRVKFRAIPAKEFEAREELP